MGLREPLSAAERHWPVRDALRAKSQLTAHAGRLAVVVNPGVVANKNDVIHVGVAAALTSQLGRFAAIEFSAHQAFDSAVQQFGSKYTVQAAATQLQQKLPAQILGSSEVGGVYVPSTQPVLSEALLHIVQQNDSPTVAHVAVIDREGLAAVDLPEHADHGDTFMLSQSPNSNELGWEHIYDSPISHL